MALSIEESKKTLLKCDKLPLDFKSNWVSALRSGNYLQAKGNLINTIDTTSEDVKIGYCCLGVAVEACGIKLNKNDIGGYSAIPKRDPRFDAVPDELANKHKLQNILYNLNDIHQLSFAEIADIIEECL